jgi:hypothetical protein
MEWLKKRPVIGGRGHSSGKISGGSARSLAGTQVNRMDSVLRVTLIGPSSTTVEEALVFDEVMGVPAHPLLVHAAVVFVPLLCLLSVVYAVVTPVRRVTGWAAAALAVAAPFAALFAKLSGDKLQQRLTAQGFSPEILSQVEVHGQYALRTLYVSIALGAVTLLLVLLTATTARRARPFPAWISIVFSLGILVLAGFTAYYIFKTGDTGAKAVWGTT